jgi:hypothetical protein
VAGARRGDAPGCKEPRERLFPTRNVAIKCDYFQMETPFGPVPGNVAATEPMTCTGESGWCHESCTTTREAGKPAAGACDQRPWVANRASGRGNRMAWTSALSSGCDGDPRMPVAGALGQGADATGVRTPASVTQRLGRRPFGASEQSRGRAPATTPARRHLAPPIECPVRPARPMRTDGHANSR